VDGRRRPEGKRHGNQHQQAPDGGDLALVVLPEMGRQQREQRNGQKDAHEGQGPDEAEARPLEFGRKGHLGHEGQGGGERQAQRAKHAYGPQRPAAGSFFKGWEQLYGNGFKAATAWPLTGYSP
jgi:hypothetical protein